MIPEISIVIPTLGDEKNLMRLLSSISRQAINFSQVEVLVILNGRSEEEFSRFKKQFDAIQGFTVKFHLLQARGVSAARNLGLQQAQGDLLYFLDDDCELHLRNTLSYHVDQHRQRPEMFALGGGYLLSAQAGLFDEIYNHIQMSWFVAGQSESAHQLKPTQYLLGGNFSAKSKILKEYQIRFEDSIVYGGSESALFKQAANRGLLMCACPAEVTHHTEETALSIRRKVYKQGRGQSLINQKYPTKTKSEQSSTQQVTEPGSRFGAWLWFYNSIFWAGYFSAEGKPFKIVSQILSDLIGKFNGWRFGVVDRLNRKK